VACIPVNPAHVEDKWTLLGKYERLTAQARQVASGPAAADDPA
jgi:hypothetical protein